MMDVFSRSELFCPAIRCPFCLEQFPNESDKQIAQTKEHFVSVHKASTAEIPVVETDPLLIELGLGPAQFTKSTVLQVVIVMTKEADRGDGQNNQMLCVSKTQVEKIMNQGIKVSSVVYRIYGDPGMVTIATPSSATVYTAEPYSSNVSSQAVLGDVRSSFCCSSQASPEEFQTDENGKISFNLSVYFGYQPTSPSNRKLKRSGGQMSLVDEAPSARCLETIQFD